MSTILNQGLVKALSGASLVILFGGLALLTTACEDSGPQKVEPQSQGQRGERCQARNDCKSGLACIGGVCSQNDFDVAVSAKQCDQVDCETTTDCCGDRVPEAPPKCADRQSICETPSIAACSTADACTDDAACNGGTCGMGRCAASFRSCTSDADCGGTCSPTFNTCSNTGASCASDADCTDSCGNRQCDCTNPAYDPFADICSDEDCENICNLKCSEAQRCVVDTSCTTDVDCTSAAPRCNAGSCVQCLEDDDCETEDGERCFAGACKQPCTSNEECPLFNSCNPDTGECVETGCTTDKECVAAFANGAVGSTLDARLAKCLPSDTEEGKNVCKFECVNDAECGQFQACEGGFCVFLGCDSNEECRAYLGLENQEKTDIRPYVSRAVCR